MDRGAAPIASRFEKSPPASVNDTPSYPQGPSSDEDFFRGRPPQIVPHLNPCLKARIHKNRSVSFINAGYESPPSVTLVARVGNSHGVSSYTLPRAHRFRLQWQPGTSPSHLQENQQSAHVVKDVSSSSFERAVFRTARSKSHIK